MWGGGEERSGLALPLWRAIFLLKGDWGGIVFRSRTKSTPSAEPHFVLDLSEEPARTRVPTDPLDLLAGSEVAQMACTEGGDVAVVLGEDEVQRWFLVVRGSEIDPPVKGRDRETLLFLAGECAGVLFLRKLVTPLPSSVSTL